MNFHIQRYFLANFASAEKLVSLWHNDAMSLARSNDDDEMIEHCLTVIALSIHLFRLTASSDYHVIAIALSRISKTYYNPDPHDTYRSGDYMGLS